MKTSMLASSMMRLMVGSAQHSNGLHGQWHQVHLSMTKASACPVCSDTCTAACGAGRGRRAAGRCCHGGCPAACAALAGRGCGA